MQCRFMTFKEKNIEQRIYVFTINKKNPKHTVTQDKTPKFDDVRQKQ